MDASFQRVRRGAALLVGSLSFAFALAAAGCGSSQPQEASSQPETPTSSKPAVDEPPRELVTTAIPPAPAPRNSQEKATEPKQDHAIPAEGSPEWLMGKLIVFRNQPLPDSRNPDALRSRNEQLAQSATEIIGKTYRDPAKETLFTAAVQVLVAAQLQMAHSGDKDDAIALHHTAEDLYKRDPASEAAAEAAAAVVSLANFKARRFGTKDPSTLREFAAQARLFATNFPNHNARSLQLLFAAAKSCEYFRIDDEAISCYTMIREKYPESLQAQRAAGVLRRLQLPGKKLSFQGETPVGGVVNIDQLKGKPALVVFWSSESEPFQEVLPNLLKVTKKHEKNLAVVGVCLDEEEAAMDNFLEKNGIDWTQIFSPDREKRGLLNPVVHAYGVQELPSIWLVDKAGTVVDIRATPASIDSEMRKMSAARQPATRRQ